MNDVRASRRRVVKFAIPTLLCCILINIPKFFESKLLYYTDENGNDQVELIPSALRTNEYYATYYSSYGRNVLIGIIPFCLLAYFNYKTYKDVQFRKDKRLARSLVPNQNVGAENSGRIGRRMKEDNLARIFCFIVGVFMVCHFPRLILGNWLLFIFKKATKKWVDLVFSFFLLHLSLIGSFLISPIPNDV